MRTITRSMLIRALGLYAILAFAAAFTLEDPRIRAISLVIVLGLAAKTGIAYLAQER